jgi:hypothetical protein
VGGCNIRRYDRMRRTPSRTVSFSSSCQLLSITRLSVLRFQGPGTDIYVQDSQVASRTPSTFSWQHRGASRLGQERGTLVELGSWRGDYQRGEGKSEKLDLHGGGLQRCSRRCDGLRAFGCTERLNKRQWMKESEVKERPMEIYNIRAPASTLSRSRRKRRCDVDCRLS